MCSHEQLEWQNKWLNAEQQSIITANALMKPLLKCASKQDETQAVEVQKVQGQLAQSR